MTDKPDNNEDDDFLKDKPEEIKQQVKELIGHLKKVNSSTLESELLLMMKRVMDSNSHKYHEVVDFSILSQEEKEAILKELAELLQELELSSLVHSASETLELVISMLLRGLSKALKRKRARFEFEYLTEKDRTRIKDELKRAAIYELYKIVNPHAVAGETKQQNYFNNHVTRGEAFARKYEGGRDKDIAKYSQDFLKSADHARHQFLKNGGFTGLVKETHKAENIINQHNNPHSAHHGGEGGSGRGH